MGYELDALGLFRGGDGWTQGTWERYHGTSDAEYCLEGAINQVTIGRSRDSMWERHENEADRLLVYQRVRAAMRNLGLTRFDSIVSLNDRTNFKTVRRVLLEADRISKLPPPPSGAPQPKSVVGTSLLVLSDKQVVRLEQCRRDLKEIQAQVKVAQETKGRIEDLRASVREITA